MGLISYQVEAYNDCTAEIDAMLPLHWEEIAVDHMSVPLDKDEESYQHFADAGMLHIVTVRAAGVLVGYIAGIVRGHLHYKSTLHCLTDVYFLHPEYRKGRVGIQLFREYEASLAKRGVRKIFISSKAHLDMSAIFERLGWRRTEVVYTKVLNTLKK